MLPAEWALSAFPRPPARRSTGLWLAAGAVMLVGLGLVMAYEMGISGALPVALGFGAAGAALAISRRPKPSLRDGDRRHR